MPKTRLPALRNAALGPKMPKIDESKSAVFSAGTRVAGPGRVGPGRAGPGRVGPQNFTEATTEPLRGKNVALGGG